MSQQASASTPEKQQNADLVLNFTNSIILCTQWRSQTENLGGPKKLGGKMFDIRRITLFCLEKRLSKHKMTIFS